MGQKSVKENKNIYFQTREELGWTREYAADKLVFISSDRLEKIENERTAIHPDEVKQMAAVYKKPDLCNYYCSHECEIGKRYVPQVQIKDLSKIILEMLASLNHVNGKKDRLIEITANGNIDDDEIKDFIAIQDELEKLSIAVEGLQLWAEQRLQDGHINMEKYCQLRAQKKEG